MNFYSALVYTSLVLSLAACHGTEKQEEQLTLPDQAGATASDDSIVLTTLVRNMYEWHERSFNGVADFAPKKVDPADTVYKSIDWTAHNNIVDRLKRSGFFASDFIEIYQKIALQIDTALKSGTALWPEGELPTIGALEGDPWVNGQDIPAENYWEKLTLTNIQFHKNEASFKWVVGDDYKYAVKAKKENGVWKISSLEGLDPKNYAITD